MQLNVSFKNLDPSPAVVAHVEHRARSIAKKTAHPDDCRLRVVCSFDAAYADIEIVGRVGRHLVVARGRELDMHDAVDRAFDKLLHQTTRDHARLVRRHRGRNGHDVEALARHA